MPDTARNRERARLARPDLAACAVWIGREGRHLAIDPSVDRYFAFDASELSRDLDHPDAVAITIAGPYIAPLDPERSTPPRAVLGVSALSGAYFGLHLVDSTPQRFVRGVHVTPQEVAATIGLADGTTAEVVRTTVDFEVEVHGRLHIRQSFTEAIAAVGQPIVSINAPAYPDDATATAIEAAGLLPPRTVTINGAEWNRRPALERLGS